MKMVMGGNDLSAAYAAGWTDRSLYMFLEITEDGKFLMTAHTMAGDRQYEYFLDPETMKYHLKADHSDAGISVSIENGAITEETADHLMVYERTDELG